MTALPGLPSIRPVEVMLAERHWPLVLPFHYGKVTVDALTEIHLTLQIELAGGVTARGHAAEIAAPKWFEKNPGISTPDSVARLRVAAQRAADLVRGATERFACIAALEHDLAQAMAADAVLDVAGLTGLERSFGVALIERAAIDGICRALGVSFEQAVAADLLGAGMLAGPDYPTWLSRRGAPHDEIAVRHTVGLDDPLEAADIQGDHPIALPDVIDKLGVTSFKIKLNETAQAIDRLAAIAAVLDRKLPAYRVTLDANEAFTDPLAFADAMACLSARPSLSRFMSAVAYVEQPLHRASAEGTDLRGLGLAVPVIIDESDGDEDAFTRALALGYSGVSVKTCKGVLRGLRNAARAAASGSFVTAEDLCVQPGICLQQNLAFAAAVRATDCERNGHHFGPGPSHLPTKERALLVAQHPDIYAPDEIRIRRGTLALGSTLGALGFGTAATPTLAWPEARLTST